MKLYCGIDLHSNNHWLTLINEHDERLVEERLANDLAATLAVLAPYREKLEAIAVESTFNWLVDGLMQADYRVKLVNTSAVRQYEGLKHRDDCDDAFHLAQLLRLGILPCGYIYPRRQRAVRDLLRHRCRLVRQRTMNVLAAKSCYARELNMKVSSAVMIGTKQQPWPAVAEPQIALVIDAHRMIIEALTQQIRRIEAVHAASTNTRRAWPLPVLVISPWRRVSPVEYSEGTKPRKPISSVGCAKRLSSACLLRQIQHHHIEL